MNTEERIQELALEWKEDGSEGVYKDLSDNLIKFLMESPFLRFRSVSEDERQELFLLLFVDREKKDGKKQPCQLRRSLADYRENRTGRTGNAVSFLSFFKGMIVNRIKDVQRKRDNYTARNPDRRPVNESPAIIFTDEIPPKDDGDSTPLDDEVLREVLNKQVRSLFFQAVDRVENDKYRLPYLFTFLFADHLKRDDLASLFDIKASSINSNMKRAAEAVAANFAELLQAQENIVPEDLYHMLRQLNSTVMRLFIRESETDPATMAVIRARFIEKSTPARIIEQHNITRDELHRIEHLVVKAFFNTLEKVRTLRSGITESGGQTMEFLESFAEYLTGAPAGDRTRADSPLDRETFACHEIFKMAIPTTRQAEQTGLRRIVSGLDREGIRQICEATALSPPEISSAIDDPQAYATQYRLLSDHLLQKTTDN